MAESPNESLLTTDDALGPQQVKKTKTLSKRPVLLILGVVGSLLGVAMFNAMTKNNPNSMTEEERLALMAEQEKIKAESMTNNGVNNTINGLMEGETKINTQDEKPLVPPTENGVAGNDSQPSPDEAKVRAMQQEIEELKILLATVKQQSGQVNNAQIQQDLQQRQQLLLQIAEMRREGFVSAMTRPSAVSLNKSDLSSSSLSAPNTVSGSAPGNQASANNAQLEQLRQRRQDLQQKLDDARARLAGLNNTGSQVYAGANQALTAPTVQGAANQALGSGGASNDGLAEYDYYKGNWELKNSMTKPNSPFMVRAGMVIQGTLISGVNSDIAGQIIGQVSQNVYDTATGKHILIPQGTRIVGTYNSGVSYGQERVMIAWQRLIFPDNKELDLGAMPGADISGYSGFEDEVNNHWWKVLSSAFLMSGFVAGVSYVTNDKNNNNNNNNNTNLSTEMKYALASQFGNVISRVIEKNLNIAPTITIRPGYRFNIMVTKDLVFGKPYQSFDY